MPTTNATPTKVGHESRVPALRQAADLLESASNLPLQPQITTGYSGVAVMGWHLSLQHMAGRDVADQLAAARVIMAAFPALDWSIQDEDDEDARVYVAKSGLVTLCAVARRPL